MIQVNAYCRTTPQGNIYLVGGKKLWLKPSKDKVKDISKSNWYWETNKARYEADAVKIILFKREDRSEHKMQIGLLLKNYNLKLKKSRKSKEED